MLSTTEIDSAEARKTLAWREMERRKAKADPCYLISHMVGVDQRDGEKFDFSHLRDPLEPGEVELVGNTLVPGTRPGAGSAGWQSRYSITDARSS